MQKAYTTFPLSTSQILDSDPEPVTFTKVLQRDQVNFPLVPTEKQREQSMLVATIARSGQEHSTWTLARPDTDDQTVYHFRLYKCWYLYRIASESL